MIETYMILNRKPKFIIKIFIFNAIFLLLLVIYKINTSPYQSYFQIHSKILINNSFYNFEVLIPEKEVSRITSQDELIIDSKTYKYHIYQIDSNIIYQNNTNYQKVYLKILNLDKKYQKNGYHIIAKIPKYYKTIMDYFKE